MVSENQAVWFCVIIKIFFKFLHFFFFADFRLTVFLLIASFSQFEFEWVCDELSNLLIDKKFYFSKPHPPGHHHHQRNIAKLHLTADLVVETIQKSQMKLL